MKSILLTQTNFNKLREEVKKNKNKELIFSSDDDELNRKVMEKLGIKILLINLAGRKDFQKQRNSGFNHVLAKIAKKNKISLGINLDEIIESAGKKKVEVLARVVQNIMLCNKDKIQMQFVSKKYSKNKYDLKSLGLILGMPTWMTKNLELVKL
jgi:ribonuclease P/MRP protein subunit RPP1